jgi:1,4-alpha-glucan branching enzyme
MPEKGSLVGKHVEVTFRMPALEGVVELYLCGDFNSWHTASAPLVQASDGTWVTTLALEAGRSYRFRYYDNQGRWHNDWDADAYVPNDFGTTDSVVDLAGIEAPAVRPVRAPAPKKKPAARKAAVRKPSPRFVPKASKSNKSGGKKKGARG